MPSQPTLCSQSTRTNEQRFAANIRHVIAADEFGPQPDSNIGERVTFFPGVTIGSQFRRFGVWLAFIASAVAAPARPNIVFILTDDQTYRAIGYNNPLVRTPVLDALATGGLIFERAYVATPICVASRASILTGLFPQQHGTIGLNSAAFVQRVVNERSLATFPQLLAAAGYRTALYGKSHLGDPKRYGFDEGDEQKQDEEAFALARSSRASTCFPRCWSSPVSLCRRDFPVARSCRSLPAPQSRITSTS